MMIRGLDPTGYKEHYNSLTVRAVFDAFASGDIATVLDFQLDPTNTPIVVNSAKGRIHFSNVLTSLVATSPGLRPGLTQEIVQLDAQDDQVFVKVHLTTTNGLDYFYYYVFDMDPDPGLTFKTVGYIQYDQGYKLKHNDPAAFEAIEYMAGVALPEPPPLPPPVCTYPFSACSFGSPSNTAAELANIAAWLAVADSFVAIDPADPTTVATFLGGFLEPVSGTRRSGFYGGYHEVSSALEFLNAASAEVGCTIAASGFFGIGADEVVATGDTVFVKWRVIGGPIPAYPNGGDGIGLDVVHMDPEGSGLIVGFDQWWDSIANEAYADACNFSPLTGRRLGEGNAYKGPALKTLLGTTHKGSGPA